MLEKLKDLTLKDSERACCTWNSNVSPTEGLPTACVFNFI